jgi:hypothetical protein
MSMLRLLKKSAGPFDPIGRALETYSTMRSLGYNHEAGSSWVGNEFAETSFDPNAEGDAHQAHGPGQHHDARINVIKQPPPNGAGIDLLTASHIDQLRAIDWEIQHAPGYRHVKQHIMDAGTDIHKIVSILVNEFEQSKMRARDIERRTRYSIRYAEQYAQIAGGNFPPLPPIG